jgi:hypothetical protein
MTDKPRRRDPKYKSIPEQFFECMLSRRHQFPIGRQRRQHVRVQFGPSKKDVLELTEFYGTCEVCGTTRTMIRDRYTHKYISAVYDYPDGYRPPVGSAWDRSTLWGEYDARHPVTGPAEIRDHRRK